MAAWRKPARIALGAFAVIFAVVLWFVMGERPSVSPVQPVERLDRSAAVEIKGGEVIQLKGASRDIRVKFGTQVSYDDGRTKLTDFEATIDNRGGRGMVVGGKEAWVGAEKSSYDLRGEVTFTTSDGLTAITPRATFTEAEGILRGDGAVKFQRANVSGSGVGFTYDRQLDRLWLNDQARITVAPEEGRGGMEITASAAGHSRLERYMRLERGATIVRAGQVIKADDVTIFLLKDRDEPDAIELRGNSSIDGAGETGSLQAMRARDINLNYAADGRTLEQALLTGQAGIQLARSDGSAGQRLEAEVIDVGLAEDGNVNKLLARYQTRVTLPAAADAPERVITATSVTAAGAAGSGITAMTFENGVEYREAGKAGQPERVARAQTLQAAMSNNDTIDRATFTTGFHFEQGKLTADSSDARYDVAKGTLALTSAANAARPRVADDRVSMNAKTIDVTLEPRQLSAAGAVVMELAAGRRRQGEQGTTLLSDKEAVFINAEDAKLDEQSGTGTYTGQARVWQQTSGTSIKGDTITINEKNGTLNAIGKVVAALPVAAAKDAKGSSSSLAQAGEFQFDDAKRRAVFVKQAQFDGVQGNLRAQRIELTLAPRDNALQRLEASETVSLTLDKREASGARLVYEPSEEKYVLTGAPVKFVEGCHEATGRSLTFFRDSDRVSMDGNQEIRTQTRGSSGKCAGGGTP